MDAGEQKRCKLAPPGNRLAGNLQTYHAGHVIHGLVVDALRMHCKKQTGN
jgi:hypothetical protein